MAKVKVAPVVTCEFRVSFPAVFKPKYNDLSKKEEFSVQALFSAKGDISNLKKAAQEACVAKWGPDQTKWPANLRSPFRKMEEKLKDGVYPDGYEAGGVFMNFKSDNRPCVVDQNKQEILEPSKFYAGCYARASVGVYAYDKMGSRGVAFGLNHLQFMRDGEPFSGKPSVESAFEPIAGGGTGVADATSIF